MDLSMPLKGCILRLNASLLAAQKTYNRRCRLIAQEQEEAHAKLLELAPKKLRGVLSPALYNLFSCKSTGFCLLAAGEERSQKVATLLRKLSRAWEDVVHVDVRVDKRGIRTRFFVNFRGAKWKT